MAKKKELLKRLLKGIETGDAEAAAVVNEARYIQHNPQTHEGSEGLAVLFARLAKTNPKVTFIRVFEDGDFAFAHNEYDFSSLRAAFEVFRFEDGKAVEHWDNIQPLKGPNPSGRGMLDGSTEIADLEKTEANRNLVRSFAEEVLVERRIDLIGKYVSARLVQHILILPTASTHCATHWKRHSTVHQTFDMTRFIVSWLKATSSCA